MTVLARTKKPELQAGYLLADVARLDEREHGHWLRTAILVAGLALVGAGLVLGLAVVWNQLARALPLAALLHRPRVLRATVLIVLGVGLVRLGRGGSRPRRRGDSLTRVGSIAVAAAIILAAGTAPALALDATGTWSGQSICRQRAGKRIPAAERRSSTMLITQRAEALFVEMDGTRYHGRSRSSRHGATRARSTLSYAADGERPSDTSAVLRLRIHIDESRGMSRLTAESSLHDTSVRRHCRYRFDRTSREDPGMAPSPPPPGAFCGDGVVDRALNEECDGDATGTPCDGACTAACSCSQPCEPLSVTGHWEGTYLSEVTRETGTAVADLSHDGPFVFGTISFPPFRYTIYSGPLVVMGACAPATFSSGAMLESGSFGILDGVATNASLSGSWRISDGSDHGTWQLVR